MGRKEWDCELMRMRECVCVCECVRVCVCVWHDVSAVNLIVPKDKSSLRTNTEAVFRLKNGAHFQYFQDILWRRQ